MEIFSVEPIFTRPLRSRYDLARDLFGSKLLGIDDDVKIAPITDIDAVELQISFPVLLVAFQG